MEFAVKIKTRVWDYKAERKGGQGSDGKIRRVTREEWSCLRSKEQSWNSQA